MTRKTGDKFLDVPQVIIDEEGGKKFILVRAFAGWSEDSESMLLIRGDKTKKYHKYIYRDLCRENKPGVVRTECIGGGYIFVHPDRKLIQIGGRSGDYGPADYEKVIEILKKEYPDFRINII